MLQTSLYQKTQDDNIGSLIIQQDCLIGMGLADILVMSTWLVPCLGFLARSSLARSRALMLLSVIWLLMYVYICICMSSYGYVVVVTIIYRYLGSSLIDLVPLEMYCVAFNSDLLLLLLLLLLLQQLLLILEKCVLPHFRLTIPSK